MKSMTSEEYNKKIDQYVEHFNSVTDHFRVYGDDWWLILMNNCIDNINLIRRWMQEDAL